MDEEIREIFKGHYRQGLGLEARELPNDDAKAIAAALLTLAEQIKKGREG